MKYCVPRLYKFTETMVGYCGQGYGARETCKYGGRAGTCRNGEEGSRSWIYKKLT
jgi:hypothetical protein